MIATRHAAILQIAKQIGRVTVDDLAARFEVSPQTVRKDLNDLCAKRQLARVHGGAILSSPMRGIGPAAADCATRIALWSQGRR